MSGLADELMNAIRKYQRYGVEDDIVGLVVAHYPTIVAALRQRRGPPDLPRMG